MPKDLEEYLTKILKKADQFLQKNFPEDYETPDVKIKVKHRNRKLYMKSEKGIKISINYIAGYDVLTKEINFGLYGKHEKEFKEDDLIWTQWRIKMRRKNTYFVSMIHELFEAQYLNYVTDNGFPTSDHDIAASHERAFQLELKALDKLIEQHEGQDKEDFIKKKQAREKELKERDLVIKLKGV